LEIFHMFAQLKEVVGTRGCFLNSFKLTTFIGFPLTKALIASIVNLRI